MEHFSRWPTGCKEDLSFAMNRNAAGIVFSSGMPNDKESSLNHTGFRLVKDVK
ncbi:MAG: hypothetical protein HRT61_13335 [Ekhidna sp.]|nr:hypothetical protein [Ekhidna sp.]